MYDVKHTVAKIKELAKEKNISTSDMLHELGLSKNTLSSMNSRGSWIASDSLAKIADYLGVSTDYLLGRSDNISGFRFPDSPLLGLKPVTASRDVVSSIIDQQLSDEEMDDVLEFIEFLKQKRDKRK